MTRTASAYLNIIQAIESGNTRLKEIADATYDESSNTRHAIAKLEKYGVVDRLPNKTYRVLRKPDIQELETIATKNWKGL